MRVPISLADLRVKYGFNRIAKKLQRNWRSTFSLSLASSQEILSKGLGYQDHHDLQKSANEHDKTVAVPTQDEVRDGISNSITDFCQSKKVTDMSERDVNHLVRLLPLLNRPGFSRHLASSLRNAFQTLPVTVDC